MSNVAQVVLGKSLEKVKAFALTNVALWPAFQLQYIGPFAFGGYAVAAGGDMTLYADNTDGLTTVHATIGIDGAGARTTTGIIDLSTPHASVDTMGELIDHFNGNPDWRAFPIGQLPSDGTDDKLVLQTSVGTAGDANGVTIMSDRLTTPLDQGFAISNNKFLYRPKQSGAGRYSGWTTDELCTNGLTFLHVDLTAVGDSNIEIYSCDDDAKTATLLWDNATTTATAEEHGGTDPADIFIQAIEGQRLLVYFDNAATNSAADVHAIGFTRHRLGGNVPGANYTGIV